MNKLREKLTGWLLNICSWLGVRLIELFGAVIFLGLIGTLLALITYDPFDDSWNVASNSPTQNALGVVGAYGSDLFLQIWGWGGLALFPAIGAFAWRRIRHTQISFPSLRVVASLAAVLFSSIALAAWPYYDNHDGAQIGGAIGQVFSAGIFDNFALLGLEFSNLETEFVTSLCFAGLALWLTLYAAGWTRKTVKLIAGLPSLMARVVQASTTLRNYYSRVQHWGRQMIAPLWRRNRDQVETAMTDDEPYAQDDYDDTAYGEIDVSGGEFATGTVEVEARKPKPKPGRRSAKEAQPSLRFGNDKKYKLPPLNLLTEHKSRVANQVDKTALETNARMLENVLSEFGVRGVITKVRPGPVVTLYEFEPAAGVRSSRVVGLADDIARSMSAIACRVATVPGANAIGIELPNLNRELVALKELLASKDFEKSKSKLTLTLGKDIGGEPVLADLTKMPHLLVAGTTGSGKSVGINTMILSILYRMTPDECRMILVDPKMLELSVYDGIPHLLAPVVTEPKKAVVALKWVVQEMENRYRKMSKVGVRNIEGYNERMRDAIAKGETLSRRVQTGFNRETGEALFEDQEIQPETVPFIVVIIDEMADLMMVAGKEIENAVQRLAQMARAAGVHLITATQRPSVDVITGTIKANFPSRISFQVTSRIDSRTVLGEQGAEQLLGQGDMLFMSGAGRLQRVHGPFVSDEEVEGVVNFLKQQGVPEYIESVTEEPEELTTGDGPGGNADALYDEAVAIVTRDGKASTSYVQRRLQIGYNRAARLIEQMEDQGVISPANHAGKREILVGKH